MAAVREVAQTLRPSDGPEAASPLSSAWLATHTAAEPAIRFIINTSASADHVGGNANIRRSPMFRVLGYRDPSLSLQVLAHEAVQRRLAESSEEQPLAPTDTYASDKDIAHRFFNNQPIQLFHAPNAVSDGDTMVWFRART